MVGKRGAVPKKPNRRSASKNAGPWGLPLKLPSLPPPSPSPSARRWKGGPLGVREGESALLPSGGIWGRQVKNGCDFSLVSLIFIRTVFEDSLGMSTLSPQKVSFPL